MKGAGALKLMVAALCAGALALGGCGSSDTDDGDGGSGVDHTSVETGNTNWITFGRTQDRTHYLEAPDRLNPPLKQLWSFSDRVLIEFPPAIYDGVAYLADKYGNVRAIQLKDRKILWDIQKDKRNVGPPSDTTAPFYYKGRVLSLIHI